MAVLGWNRSDLALAAQQARQSAYVVGVRPARPWLTLIGLIALSAAGLVAVVFGIGVVLAGVMLATGSQLFDTSILDGSVPEGPLRLNGEVIFLVILAGSLIVMALAVLAAAMIVYRQRIGAFLWPGRRPSWRQLWIGFGVMAVISLTFLPIAWFVEPGGVMPLFNDAYPIETRVTYALAAAALLLVAAAGEEIVFRGVLLRVTAGFTQRIWLLCLINAVLFSAIHLDPDPVAFVARALSGFVWTWAALRLGGIEFAIGAHWANNLIIAWLGEPLSEAAMPGQNIPAPYLVLEVVTVALIFIAIEWLARRRARVAA